MGTKHNLGSHLLSLFSPPCVCYLQSRFTDWLFFSGCMSITLKPTYPSRTLESFIPSLHFPVVHDWCAEFLVFILGPRRCSGSLNNLGKSFSPNPQASVFSSAKFIIYMVKSLPALKCSSWSDLLRPACLSPALPFSHDLQSHIRQRGDGTTAIVIVQVL